MAVGAFSRDAQRAGSRLLCGLAGASLLLLAIPGGSGAQESSPSPARPKVVYGGNDSSPPFEYLDQAGVPQGFSIELMRALARVSGREVEFRLGVWKDIVSAVQRREVDVVTLGYADARTAEYDFVAETWTLRQAVFFAPGRASYPRQASEMRGETVAVQLNSIVHEMLRGLPEAQRPSILEAPNHLDAAQLLVRREATAAAGNSLVLRRALERSGMVDAVEVPVRAASYQLATLRGRGPDLAWIPPALQRIKESGEYSQLVEKHLAAQGRPSRLPIVVGGLVATLVMGGLGYVGASLWNASLRRQVAARTRELLASVDEKDRLTASLVEREAERERLIANLEAKNAELERFSYTVSHDLKSPLVTIGAYSGLLEKHARAGDMESFASDLARVQRAGERMRRLLDELLDLSRVGRVVNPPEEISLRDLAHEAAALVKGRLAERQVDVRISDDLPTVRGDRVRLLEVLLNLIDNAAKFVGDGRAPRIEVGAVPDQPAPSFFVRDNGIGIDPQHHERVFRLFDKLEAGSEGTGVGLALVRRIVEAHGGRVWIESQGKGQGATFHVSLPS
ncbi:MAG: transporter substrate-binding domain-containing protein [Vicinamibacteria bacterium]|nr:transporter substrate-binding domain-containing protein [Vicinamibacteria bacterium]